MTAVNTQSYIQPPIGGGLGNKKTAMLEMDIETYVTDGVAMDMPTGNFIPVSVMSESATYTFIPVLDTGVWKMKVYSLVSTYDEGPPITVTTALTQVSATTDVGVVRVFLIGV